MKEHYAISSSTSPNAHAKDELIFLAFAFSKKSFSNYFSLSTFAATTHQNIVCQKSRNVGPVHTLDLDISVELGINAQTVSEEDAVRTICKEIWK